MSSISLVTGSLQHRKRNPRLPLPRPSLFLDSCRETGGKFAKSVRATPKRNGGAQWSATTDDACRLYPRVGGGRGIIQFSAMQSRRYTHGRTAWAVAVIVRSPAAILRVQGCTAAGATHGVHRCRSVDTRAAITPPMSPANYDDGFRPSIMREGAFPFGTCSDFNNPDRDFSGSARIFRRSARCVYLFAIQLFFAKTGHLAFNFI